MVEPLGFWESVAAGVMGGAMLVAFGFAATAWRLAPRLKVEAGTAQDFPIQDSILDPITLPFLRLILTARSPVTPVAVTLQATAPLNGLVHPVRLFRPALEVDGSANLQPGTVQPLTIEFPHKGWQEQVFVSVLELRDVFGYRVQEARFTLKTVSRSRRRLFRVHVDLDTGVASVSRWRP